MEPVGIGAQILAFFASKAGAAIKTGLAIVAVPLLVATIWQTTEIYGFNVTIPVLGQYNLIEGLKHKADTAQARIDTNTLWANKQVNDANGRYNALVASTNAATEKLRTDSEKAQKAADAQVAKAQADLKHEQELRKQNNALLRKALDNANPKDASPLSPAVIDYLNGLRLGR